MFIFFFKQKTSYEMRISDWSSDVCSSDLWAPLYYIPGIIWLFAKIFFFFFAFSWVKATVPRYRYDQLMRLGWKVFLPLSLFWVFLVSGFLMLTRFGGDRKCVV